MACTFTLLNSYGNSTPFQHAVQYQRCYGPGSSVRCYYCSSEADAIITVENNATLEAFTSSLKLGERNEEVSVLEERQQRSTTIQVNCQAYYPRNPELLACGQVGRQLRGLEARGCSVWSCIVSLGASSQLARLLLKSLALILSPTGPAFPLELVLMQHAVVAGPSRVGSGIQAEKHLRVVNVLVHNSFFS
ncbi:hypothetical protein DL764_003147 [Monosporascus ibericus]|uniref:Uncharacterized protein n=1 Tax=Monosporascus ibericus TaxID=155417 RepID=A0A4Q4THP4_9PEZI|nr:hypothetical protein DL764_003147 [Monosporascus ibericus]